MSKRFKPWLLLKTLYYCVALTFTPFVNLHPLTGIVLNPETNISCLPGVSLVTHQGHSLVVQSSDCVTHTLFFVWVYIWIGWVKQQLDCLRSFEIRVGGSIPIHHWPQLQTGSIVLKRASHSGNILPLLKSLSIRLASNGSSWTTTTSIICSKTSLPFWTLSLKSPGVSHVIRWTLIRLPILPAKATHCVLFLCYFFHKINPH